MMHNSAVNMLHDLHLNNKAGGSFNKAAGACLNKIVVLILENHVNHTMLPYRFIDGFIGHSHLFIKQCDWSFINCFQM